MRRSGFLPGILAILALTEDFVPSDPRDSEEEASREGAAISSLRGLGGHRRKRRKTVPGCKGAKARKGLKLVPAIPFRKIA